jgi:hypothetical protein
MQDARTRRRQAIDFDSAERAFAQIDCHSMAAAKQRTYRFTQ